MEVGGRLFLLDDLRDLLDWFYRSDFIVYIHDGHKDRIVADCLPERV